VQRIAAGRGQRRAMNECQRAAITASLAEHPRRPESQKRASASDARPKGNETAETRADRDMTPQDGPMRPKLPVEEQSVQSPHR
jgi:hypothetical protein